MMEIKCVLFPGYHFPVDRNILLCMQNRDETFCCNILLPLLSFYIRFTLLYFKGTVYLALYLNYVYRAVCSVN